MGAFKVVKLVDPIFVATNGVALAHSGATATSGTFLLAEGNNITFSTNGNTVTIHGGAGVGGGVGIAAGTQTGNTGTIKFENSNGITFGMSGSTRITASHNGLTIQTTQPMAYSAANGSANFSTLTFANSNGVSFSTGTQGVFATVKTDYLTTAMQSNAATLSNIRVSAGTTSNLLSAMTFSNGNGVSFGLDAGTITASVKTDYLTTARASTDAIGLNTAQTNVTWTVNSSGLSLDARGYAGTGTSKTGGAVITLNSNGLAFDGSALAGTATTFNGANISGSMTVNTAGVNLSMSVAAPGAAAENNWVHALGANTAGNTTASGSTIGYSGINLTISGTNNSVMNLSVPATSSLSATGIVSLSTNGSTISIGAGMTTQSSYWEGIDAMTLLHAGANGNISVERFKVDQYVSASMIGLPLYQSLASSAAANTYGQQWSIYAMVLTNDTANNRLMSLSSGSTQTTYTIASNTAGATQLNGSGVRPLTVPININMTPGIYYMAFNLSTNTFSSGTATTALARTASFIGRGPIMSASFGMVSAYDVATGNTNNRLWPQGVVSGGASAGIPATISHSQMTMTGLSHSQANLAFYMRA